jgi:transposase
MGDRSASGLGAPLTARLRSDGVDVLDVPAKLAARVRELSTGHGRKNDEADAVSVGIAALSAHRLTTVAVDDTVTALRAIGEHRDDLVKTRTQTVNRLHVVLTRLVPAGAQRDLTADRAAALLRGIHPRDAAGKTLRSLAADLVTEIRQLDRHIAKAAGDIQTAVSASGTTLTELGGIGALTAGKILGRVGTINRFRSAAAFATSNGAAPIDVSSGDVVRHRLSRAGDRQLNLCLHVMALTQIRQETPGRAYYLRKRAEGKGHKEAMRCLKRRLSDVVYRQLLSDATRLGAGPGGHSGAALQSSAAS